MAVKTTVDINEKNDCKPKPFFHMIIIHVCIYILSITGTITKQCNAGKQTKTETQIAVHKLKRHHTSQS